MTNQIKETLAAGKVSIGTWHTVCSIEVAEALATLGFDWVSLDMEHSSADISYAEAAFIAIERHGCAPFARMPSADPILARRLLDAGAHGLLIPVVEDAAAFAAFAEHCLYPPHGRRGVSLERFNRWGDDFDGYMRDFRPVLIPMIESRKGVAAADTLAALPSVDALFFGPYDLSADLGAPGNFSSQAFVSSLDTVKASCVKYHKAPGGHQVAMEPEELRQKIEGGFRFIGYGTDILAMRRHLAGFREVIRR
jgi:2-keto-3-deoxy-L-rhamnonate aldolase RhmA